MNQHMGVIKKIKLSLKRDGLENKMAFYDINSSINFQF